MLLLPLLELKFIHCRAGPLGRAYRASVCRIVERGIVESTLLCPTPPTSPLTQGYLLVGLYPVWVGFADREIVDVVRDDDAAGGEIQARDPARDARLHQPPGHQIFNHVPRGIVHCDVPLAGGADQHYPLLPAGRQNRGALVDLAAALNWLA